MRAPTIRASILALDLALPSLASAVSGGFAPGTPRYPVTIDAPGSDRLTSNLAPLRRKARSW